MSDKPFFVLKVTDDFPITIMCLDSIEEILIEEGVMNAPILEDIFTKGYRKLKKVFPEIDFDKIEDYYKLKDIELDYDMCQAMMHIIITVFQDIKVECTKFIDKEKEPEAAAKQEDFIELFNEIKDEAADLLSRLTKALRHNDVGLKSLESIFERKIAERPIEIINDTEKYKMKFNKSLSIMFGLIFRIIDNLFEVSDKYKFAERVVNSQYINFSDYMIIRRKYENEKLNKVITFSEKEYIILYFILNIFGRYFVSDAVETYEQSFKNNVIPNLKKNEMKKFRNKILSITKELMNNFEIDLSNNKNFKREIKRIENWPIEMD